MLTHEPKHFQENRHASATCQSAPGSIKLWFFHFNILQKLPIAILSTLWKQNLISSPWNISLTHKRVQITVYNHYLFFGMHLRVLGSNHGDILVLLYNIFSHHQANKFVCKKNNSGLTVRTVQRNDLNWTWFMYNKQGMGVYLYPQAKSWPLEFKKVKIMILYILPLLCT